MGTLHFIGEDVEDNDLSVLQVVKLFLRAADILSGEVFHPHLSLLLVPITKQ